MACCFQVTASNMYIPFYLAMIADAPAKIGEPDQRLDLLAQALITVESTEERHWEEELYRLKGELTLQAKFQDSDSPAEKDAEECFSKAIHIVRREQAKSLELWACFCHKRAKFVLTCIRSHLRVSGHRQGRVKP